MNLIKLTVLVFFVIGSAGCAPLKKTGKFVVSVPGKIIAGVAKTGTFTWKLIPKTGPQVKETAKVIWGSSTKALEDARVDAIEKTYRCSYDACFDSVLTLTRKKTTRREGYKITGKLIEDAENEEEDVGVFDVFINDRVKKHIVVMGIEGNVDTTAVGIFFSQPSLTTVKLEVSSLSGNAKRRIAEAIFDQLDSHFSTVE